MSRFSKPNFQKHLMFFIDRFLLISSFLSGPAHVTVIGHITLFCDIYLHHFWIFKLYFHAPIPFIKLHFLASFLQTQGYFFIDS